VDQAEFERRKAELMRQIRACRTQISQAQASANNNRAEIERCNSEISVLNGQIENCRNEIRAHQNYIAQAQNVFDRIGNRDTRMAESFASVNRRVGLAAGLSATMKFAQRYTEMMNRELSSTKSKVAMQLADARTSIGRRISDRQSKIDNLNSQISSKNRRISDLRSRISTLNKSATDSDARVRELNNRIAQLEREIRTLQQQVTT
jgi:peptidoglycan hydrolase CwlO-like protein